MSRRIQVVSASAGTGKTWRLADELLRAIRGGQARPEAVVAITYTKKAAAELARRLRGFLLRAGDPRAASRVRDGYLGTIHSVAQRLVAEFAFDAGLSPDPEPAPEAFAAELLHEVSDEAMRDRAGDFQRALDLWSLLPRDGSRAAWREPESWRDAVARIASEARANRMDASALRAAADASLAQLLALLDAPRGSGPKRDAAMAARLRKLRDWTQGEIAAAAARGKRNKSAESRDGLVAALLRRLDRGAGLPWADLARFRPSGAWNTRAAQDAAGLLAREGASHLDHPRLHEETRTLLPAVFGVAAEVGTAFTDRKRAERLLDFDDMLALGADVLGRPDVRARLRGRVDLLLVDEFQDSSPVQLQIILSLAELAARTVWVGDRKQSIFAFSGADPSLMEEASAAALGGASPERLGRNFRSRPPLVRFCSEVFAAAMEGQGFDPDDVAVEPACPEPTEFSREPSLELWRVVDDPRFDDEPRLADGVARGVRTLLRGGARVRERVGDPREPAPTRKARAGDVAVLARTNAECQHIASALHSQGLRALVARDGLGATGESWLLRAALALLADPGDRLAAAEIAWFRGGGAADPGAWLADRVRHRDAQRSELNGLSSDPTVAALLRLKERAGDLSPLEALDAAMLALDAPRLVLGWSDPPQRLANLEALRGVARGYEEECAVRRTAATVAGLAMRLGELDDGEAQALPSDPEAVRVLTYHKAKGLEWPVVVLTSLDREVQSSPFGVRVEPAPRFDAERPLAGRSLRYWPHPYGAQSSGLDLLDRGHAQPVAKRLVRNATRESIRLLYVGFTRARDRLVLAATGTGRATRAAGLDALTRKKKTVLSLPWTAEGSAEGTVRGLDGDSAWPCFVRQLPGFPEPDAAPVRPAVRWVTAPDPIAPASARTERDFRPSSAVLPEGVQVRVVEEAGLGGRRVIPAGVPMDALGNAIHAFLAADGDFGNARRRELATRIARAHSPAGGIDPSLLPACADPFFAWLRERTAGTGGSGAAGAAPMREWPVRQRLPDGRILAGSIDLLAPLRDGWLLLDHKSFPGDRAQRDLALKKHAAQLRAYGGAVEAATKRPVLEMWIHLPVRGECVRVELGGPAAS